MSIIVLSEHSLLTSYACGHTYRTGLNGNSEERERLKKIGQIPHA